MATPNEPKKIVAGLALHLDEPKAENIFPPRKPFSLAFLKLLLSSRLSVKSCKFDL